MFNQYPLWNQSLLKMKNLLPHCKMKFALKKPIKLVKKKNWKEKLNLPKRLLQVSRLKSSRSNLKSKVLRRNSQMMELKKSINFRHKLRNWRIKTHKFKKILTLLLKLSKPKRHKKLLIKKS